jgi:hypothetical protein
VSVIGANVGLLVASAELDVVRLIRGAIAVADQSGGGAAGNVATPGVTAGRSDIPAVDQPLTYRAVDYRQQTPAVDVSNARHPAATYDRHRPIVHLPRVYDCGRRRHATEASLAPTIQPPWRSLPWPVPPVQIKQVHRTIKIMPGRTDVRDVGQMLDLFI